MSKEQDKIFFRNFAIVTALITIAMGSFMFLGRMFGIDEEAEMERQAKRMTEQAAEMVEQTAPVGEVSVAGETEEATEEMATTTAGGKSGEEVYNGMCIACHSVPGIGSPVVGNAEDWAPRAAQGKDTLYNNAINGFTGPGGFMMPPRGGGQFSDDEVKAAVDYMVSNSE